MPPKALPICKYEGCTAARHIYPNGSKCQYCREHMRHRKAKQREGQPSMTGQMRDVLSFLRQMKAQGDIWCELGYPFAHGRTLKGLQERDWIFASESVDGWRYKLTYRGEQALTYFESTEQHRDGLCPRCRLRPRHVRSSGAQDSYCVECLRHKGVLKRKSGKDIGNPDRPCSRCRKRSRHQYPNGKYSTYCKHCERVNRRRNARKERRAEFKRVQAGGAVPLCQNCKQQPRIVFKNSMSKYCSKCVRMVAKRHKLKRRMQAHFPQFT